MLLAGLIGAVVSAAGHGHLSRAGALVLGAGVPLGLTLLALAPLVAHPPAGLARSSGGILMAVEGVRWVAYGAALGNYAPLAARIRPSPRPAP